MKLETTVEASVRGARVKHIGGVDAAVETGAMRTHEILSASTHEWRPADDPGYSADCA